MAEINLREIREAHPDKHTIAGALVAEVTRLRAEAEAVPAVDRTGILAVFMQFFAHSGMPEHVSEWFPDEREFYREGDYNSFAARRSTIWQMRMNRAADALIAQLAGVPTADTKALPADLHDAIATPGERPPEQVALLVRAADELARLREPEETPTAGTSALAGEFLAAALDTSIWEAEQTLLLARAGAELSRLAAGGTPSGTLTIEFTNPERVIAYATDMDEAG